MKVLLDACVLFPTVLRELVLGVADAGVFTPLWSPRVLEEWRRAALKLGPLDGEIAASEIASATAMFPGASVAISPETEAELHLPDPDDRHVLAAAIDGAVDELLTLNIKDFPLRVMAEHNVVRRHPDEFLLEALHSHPDAVRGVVDRVLAKAASHGIDVSDRRKLLKRARVPRFAKALDQV